MAFCTALLLTETSLDTTAGERMACSSDSAPHKPHPVRPTRLRLCLASLAKQSSVTVKATSSPSSRGITLIPRNSVKLWIMPSVRLKPMAKSSNSEGVAIMTTWDCLLYVSATGTSLASWSSRLRQPCSSQFITATWCETGTVSPLLPGTPQAPRLRALSSKAVCCRLKACCCFCHSDGCVTRVTCTAVTLYSGQLVAQSELSVVTMFAPVIGK